MQIKTGEGYSGPERRSERQSELIAINRRLRDGDAMMLEFREALEANTKLTMQTAQQVSIINENTSGFIAFSQDLVAGTKFLCRCAKGVQWFAEMLRKNMVPLLLLAAVWAYSTNQQKLLEMLFSAIKP